MLSTLIMLLFLPTDTAEIEGCALFTVVKNLLGLHSLNPLEHSACTANFVNCTVVGRLTTIISVPVLQMPAGLHDAASTLKEHIEQAWHLNASYIELPSVLVSLFQMTM